MPTSAFGHNPERIAALLAYLDAHLHSTIAFILGDLLAKGYNMREIRYAYKVWIDSTSDGE